MKTTRTVRCSRSAAVAQIFNLLYRGFATRLARGLPQDRATLRRLPAGDTAGSKPALQAMGVRRRPAIPLSRLLAILCLALFVGSVRAADDVTTALQQGLFEEEANQNLDAAIKAYQAVLERHDEQRKLASTALFRLGECYRKLGRTNDAVAQYERLLRDYSDQTMLVTLSKQNLVGLGIGTVLPLPATGTTATTAAVSVEAEELARTERILAQLKGWDLGQVRRLIPTLAPDAELEQLEKRFQAAQESAQKAPNDQLRNEALKLLDMTTSRMSDRFDEIVKLIEKRAADLRQVVAKQTPAQAGPLPSPDFNARLKAITDTAATNEEENEVRRIQALIKDSPDLINAGQGFLAETPLLSATRKGQLGVARFLLENKADPNLADSGGITPLMAAASAGHRAFCELLLQRGANPNAKSDPSQPGSIPAYRRSALHHAAYGGNRAVVEVLLDFKADPNIADQFKGTPLCDAAARGFISVAQLLLERGANPNLARAGAPGITHPVRGSGYDAPEYMSGSPLHFAVQRSSQPLLELLLTHQADVNLRRSHDSISPLDLAAQLGDTNLVALLLAAKAGANTSPDSGSTQGWTALHHAVYNVRRDVAELLLKNGANPNARIAVAWPDKRSGESGFTPLLIANDSVQPQLGLLLLDFNADPNLKSSIGNAPLHTALYPVFLNAARSREYITALLDRGAEVQAPNASGFSPLSQATWTGQRELVQLLLDRGADPNQRDMGDDKKGRLLTPLSGLMTITNKDMVAVVEALLQAKADPNLKSELGYTALHRAIMLNQPARTIELLTTHGANLETTTSDGETPLTLAANAREPKELLQVLLKAGANPNARGKFGFTALHKAVGRGDLGAFEVLLAAGANPNLTDEQGVTPLDLAKLLLKTPPPPGQTTATATQTQMLEALRKAGAIEWAPRPNQITIFRRSTGAMEVPFLKDKAGRNRFSLFEVIATIGFGSETRFPFPDLTNVTITRIEAGSGALTNFTVNIAGRVASGDCRQNLWLEWGDLIEVPELEHKLTDQWAGPTTEFVRAVTNCLSRSFTLTVKGQPAKRTWHPLVNTMRVNNTSGALGDLIPVGFNRMRFSLMAVVHDSGLLLSSSDRSRVKVKRTDPDTGEVREWTYNVEKDAGHDDLWVRDGDVIEVPEK